ncbi:VOC family protein [Actinopolymorpha sp. NPDC004070]|uniref:VOC family protein n=1 Tax=Actinopolymorpha sp. NPDC004070 TaxID=3154548 RepID=UPI0033B414C7
MTGSTNTGTNTGSIGTDAGPVGTLGTVAFDCPDPRALGEFYARVLGGKLEISEDEDDWVDLRLDDGRRLSFQQADDWASPTWPGGERPQQAHIDVEVPDLDAAEERVLALGARKVDHQPGSSWRVFLDPVGHPFCLCAC